MYKRVALALALLLLLLAGGLWTLSVTDRLFETLAQELIDGDFTASFTRWERAQPLLSALVTHDRVDEISQCYARADAFRRADTMDEYRAEVQTVLLLLSLLRNYDRPTMRSIL